MSAVLHVKNLYKSFPHAQSPTLDNVSFSIDPGQIIGLIGDSGSGKSTLLRCIKGLEIADRGSIECSGRKGFMFQDFQLFPHMDVLDNIIYAAKFHGINNSQAHDKAMQMLDNMSMLSRAHHKPHQLSGGQKQRVALLRCLLLEPALLLCDEPNSGLDIFTSASVAEMLLQARNDSGAAMIISSHDLYFLSSLADRIIMLRSGCISNEYSPAQFKNLIKELMPH